MIVVEEEDDLLLITQCDHARLAAELLVLWQRDALAMPPRREELLFTVREHDNGWREADAAPHVDVSTGRPFDFASLPVEPRQEIWLRGAERWIDLPSEWAKQEEDLPPHRRPPLSG